MSVNYSSAIPENNKSSYGEYDTLDFVMTFENQSLRLGSLRLEAELEVTHNSLPLNNAANETKVIKFDNMVGGHVFIDSVQTEMLGEVFENVTEYPRLVKQYSVAGNTISEMLNSSKACELRCPYDFMTTQYMKGVEPRTQVAPAIRENPDFSIKLESILNSSQDELPYSRSGAIRVSVNLARNLSVFYGADVDANTSYALKNVRLVYRTLGRMDNTDPITLRRVINIKQSIQSSLANIQTKVPSQSVEAFSASFQIQSHENTGFYNNCDLEKLPNLNQLQFLFNDQTNAQITYLLKNNADVLKKYVEALGSGHKNRLAPANVINNEGYGVGLRMSGGVIDLTQQKFSVQIDSAVSNNTPLLMYMYFHTTLSV